MQTQFFRPKTFLRGQRVASRDDANKQGTVLAVLSAFIIVEFDDHGIDACQPDKLKPVATTS